MAVGDKYFAVMKNELAVSNGVATLGPDGLLNASQRPITDSMPTQGSSNPVQSGGVYSALSNKADKGAPQEYSLPMAEGLIQSSASWYIKNQFGQVHVHGAISAGSGSLGWDTLVATLPEGYRPGAKIEAPATFESSGTSGSGAVAMAADGTIRVFPDISAAQKVVRFDLFFLASGLG